jgi:hypothetical protein
LRVSRGSSGSLKTELVDRLRELNAIDADALDHVLEKLGLFERAEVA